MNPKPCGRIPWLALAAMLYTSACASVSVAGQYTNFNVAIYIPVGIVRTFETPGRLSNEWDRIQSQLKVDKVYIEVERNRVLASDELLERVKRFFVDRGVQVAGGMTLSDEGGGGQFKSFCYTDPGAREFIRKTAELAARHFDEVIQDDFFFITTKEDSDIAAKGDRSWTQFRLDLADDAAENLLIKPAKAVNPKVKMIIKYPNWYEHFQGLGFDLEKEPKLFDGIYTGTETRDPEMTDQNLQQYESYQIFRYFENIKPGGNLGGWVDTFNIRTVDRYAEQLWDTMFAKAPEMTLFNWAALLQPIRPGDRSTWENLNTSFNYNAMLQTYKARVPGGPDNPSMASAAAYALEHADAVVGKLGRPIGIQCYKPYHSSGEDFIHNYFGNIGIPIDLHPEFPTNASLVLLTESAKADPGIVGKIKRQLADGKSVVITSGLLRALQGRGIEDIVELECTGRKILAREYSAGYGSGDMTAVDGEGEGMVLFPEIKFWTNDSWALVRAMAQGKGYPLLLMNRYSKGVLYVWTIPDNLNDLYRLPVGVLSAIKRFVMAGFPVRVDGPGQVAMFAYDNNTLIVESYRSDPAEVTVSVAGEDATLRDLSSGETISAQEEAAGRWARRGRDPRTAFTLPLPPHSFRVLEFHNK